MGLRIDKDMGLRMDKDMVRVLIMILGLKVDKDTAIGLRIDKDTDTGLRIDKDMVKPLIKMWI